MDNRRFNFRHWSEAAPPLAKDEAMPRTEEYFIKILAMDNELIHEMKDEIAKLKSKVNRLEQKLASKQTVIDVFNETSAKKRDTSAFWPGH